MCRFLLFKSKSKINPRPILKEFAIMAEKSKAFDGDWQGDGWGISWLDQNNKWQLYKSLKPVWKDVQSINRLNIKTRILTVHARSASFPQHNDNLDFNQPYINNRYSFVFNGYLKGVSLTVPGKIGAEKIWTILKKSLLTKNLFEALAETKTLLINNSREIQALNIGITDGKNIYALCYYIKYSKYYQLHSVKKKGFALICSESLDGYDFCATESGSILSF